MAADAETKGMSSGSERQSAHYDSILGDYDRHYFDSHARHYRERFFYDPLFAGLSLDGKTVLDLACGSGYNSLAILKRFPDARVGGIDISPEACAAYERVVQRSAHRLDLTDPAAVLPPPADVAVVIGGLHHCANELGSTLDNISRLIVAGGWLLLAEPNAEFFLNAVRRSWYRHDRYFDAETERPLCYSELLDLGSSRFRPVEVRYMGGLGYFLVLNSLLFRLPHGLKRAISRPLSAFDGWYNRLGGKAPFPYFIARWQRTIE